MNKLIILEVQPLKCDLIESIEYNIGVVLLKCFVEFLSIRQCLYNKQTLLFIANMFGIQKWSTISAHMLIIEASKINTCVKGDKWIDTIKCFQWYNYNVYYIDLRSIKTEMQIILT